MNGQSTYVGPIAFACNLADDVANIVVFVDSCRAFGGVSFEVEANGKERIVGCFDCVDLGTKLAELTPELGYEEFLSADESALSEKFFFNGSWVHVDCGFVFVKFGREFFESEFSGKNGEVCICFRCDTNVSTEEQSEECIEGLFRDAAFHDVCGT